MSRVRKPSLLLSCALLFILVLNACGTTGSADNTSTSGKVLQVVAGENFWGSIATQLGGTHANVTSIVTDPNADPHQYESNTADARLFAQADYVILNGVGYDTWAQKLLERQSGQRPQGLYGGRSGREKRGR